MKSHTQLGRFASLEEQLMQQSTVLKNNRSQVIRLPRAVALSDEVKWVDVLAVGRTRIISPAGESWNSWFDGESVSDDFFSQRDQPSDPRS
ncbi:SpoVT/AbrB-like protein [Pseudomonas syringae pv. actinidiae]|uniref:SpoVT/AbrB-like protein n=1 Tax=Pseudomonas syringae pv. actinidiae TaxID=103796 RepID=A0A3M4KLQ5_PSESF|nr:SpoVT/AbrB-like protein [Pseudomonas syringae pv. actinidiae]